MPPERRLHQRCPPQADYFLSCRALERPRDPSLFTRLIDVAPGGVRLATADRLSPGLRLILEIRLPEAFGRFRAEAVVAWSDAHIAGLRFDRVDEGADLPEPAAGRRSSEPRRRHKRFFPGRGDLTFAPFTLWTSLGFRPRDAALRLVDLSLSGAHLVCRERLKPGATGRLTFDVSHPRATVEGEARVVWCRRDTLKLAPEWHVGLAFRKLADPHSVRTLDRHFLG